MTTSDVPLNSVEYDGSLESRGNPPAEPAAATFRPVEPEKLTFDERPRSVRITFLPVSYLDIHDISYTA